MYAANHQKYYLCDKKGNGEEFNEKTDDKKMDLIDVKQPHQNEIRDNREINNAQFLVAKSCIRFQNSDFLSLCKSGNKKSFFMHHFLFQSFKNRFFILFIGFKIFISNQ